jgi:hypothetical protein
MDSERIESRSPAPLRARDERLDLLRREPRRLGLHRHLRLHEIGKDIELRIFRDVQSVKNQAHRQRDNHAARAKGKFNQSSQHD